MIEELELRGGPVVLHKDEWDEDVVLPDPRTMHYQEVLRVLRDRDFEGLQDKKISIYSIDTIMDLWRSAYDLPDINAAIRLTYVMDHYGRAIDYDLRSHLGLDAEELWRDRQWGRLLNYIDRLPSHTWYSQMVTEDPEHTELLVKQLAEAEMNGEKKPDPSPPIHTWTPEVAKMADVHDAIKELIHLTASINSQKAVPEPTFSVRPNAELKRRLERLKYELREARHQELVSRLLPNR